MINNKKSGATVHASLRQVTRVAIALGRIIIRLLSTAYGVNALKD